MQSNINYEHNSLLRPSQRPCTHSVRWLVELEAAEVVSSRFSRLEGLRIDPRWVGNDFAAALKRFVKLHDQLPQALAELENRVEDSRPLTHSVREGSHRKAL